MSILNEFKTSDVSLAAYLKMQSFTIIDVEVVRTKGFFKFDKIEREEVTKFNNGTATVEPGEFSAVMRQLIQTVRRRINDNG